ncbi:DUF4097 domain-containing protein [Streptomyces coeruleoprunus]|uniref:DUF4097 domain-containing protein n=1 Tax=Streptomyces coeruleoprunus TaxID=285563 RepID=A0ABV9XGV9_9ACTN
MPEFDTPEPISATLEFDIGAVRIVAGKRTTTVVEIRPTDPAEENDVRVAQQTAVSCRDGRLLVKGPRKRSLFGRSGSIEVTVELPAGSDVLGNSPMADFLCEGRLGECRLKTSVGDFRVAEAAAVNLRTPHGTIAVDRVTGDAEITGGGRIDIGEIGGTAVVRNLNGDTTIGEITGELRASSSYGPISVGVAHAGVDAKSAHGGIRIGDVARGTVTLQTSAGDVEVGIRESTAAWLDVYSRIGSVRNSLGATEGPGDSTETVEVKARTSLGDILIHRAKPTH